jgi:4-amino-4-deoxy-L-arabinose transferase-like glycosyltransferase
MLSVTLPADLRRLIFAFLALKLGVHVAVAIGTPFEFHRDELLYHAMGSHLRFFQMDFPPFIAVLAELIRHTTGATVFMYRLVPGLAGAAVMAVALLLVHRLGGSRMAVVLTSIALLANPLFQRTAVLFQPVVFDQLAWTLVLYACVELCESDDIRWWIALGVSAGFGLLTKFSIAFIGVGVLTGLVLTEHRRRLATRGPWLALLIALVIGSPSLIGQYALHWPVVDQMAQLQRSQLDRVTWGEFLGAQPFMLGPGVLLALAGTVAFLRGPLERYRLLGVACLATFLLLGVTHGKPYYVGPLYPTLIAAGAVWVERLAPRTRRITAWSVGVASAAFGFAVLPMGLPILPAEQTARYAAALGIEMATRTNWGTQLTLPQDYADMLGWREKAEAVARVVESLTPEERAKTVLYGNNYGQAGALDLYGRRLGLPAVVSLAGSFYTFGPGSKPGEVIVFLGVRREDLNDLHCASLDDAGRVQNAWGVGEERDVPILVCRAPRLTLQQVWQHERPRWG